MFPVSIKAVLRLDGFYPLLLNEREEWELPGGKLEKGENIEDCIVREVREELNVDAKVVRPLNNWVYHVNGIDVVIVTYFLVSDDAMEAARVSEEHQMLRFFDDAAIAGLNMPEGYKDAIRLSRTFGNGG